AGREALDAIEDRGPAGIGGAHEALLRGREGGGAQAEQLVDLGGVAEVARALRRDLRVVVEDERGGEGEGSIARRAAEYGPAARAHAAPRRGGGVGRGIDEGDEGARGRGEADVGGERGPSQRLRPLHAGRAGAGVLDPHLEP